MEMTLTEYKKQIRAISKFLKRPRPKDKDLKAAYDAGIPVKTYTHAPAEKSDG